MTAREITRARGGDWRGTYGMLPGPGHGPKDRSLKVWDYCGRTYVHSFAGDHWQACRAYLGLDDDWQPSRRPTTNPLPAPAKPSARIRELLRTSTSRDLVPDVVAYLKARKLWPVPANCALKAHVGAPYWNAGDPPELVGRFPALLAPVVDIDGELVTVHVTFLKDGWKLANHEPRKLLSGTTGRVGCAVRLMPLCGPVLAVGEGLETSLAFHKLSGLPTWSCLSSGLLGRFKPPPGVEHLVGAADRDDAGMAAADKLAAAEVPVEIRLPVRKDFAADLESGQ